jgi:hypothetical protein
VFARLHDTEGTLAADKQNGQAAATCRGQHGGNKNYAVLGNISWDRYNVCERWVWSYS